MFRRRVLNQSPTMERASVTVGYTGPKSSEVGIVIPRIIQTCLCSMSNCTNPDRGSVLDMENDYDAGTGCPITGPMRSPHYFHSGFLDLNLSRVVDIRPRADDVLEVNPLADGDSVSFFRAERILYHGHDIAVQWNGTAGLTIEIDGEAVAGAPDLTRLTVNKPASIQGPIPQPKFAPGRLAWRPSSTGGGSQGLNPMLAPAGKGQRPLSIFLFTVSGSRRQRQH